MSHIESFDNLDDMFAKMDAAEDAANLALTPGQIRIRDDAEVVTYWARAIPEWDLVLYGETMTISDLQGQDRGFDPIENRARGYLTGTVFSADTPGGEGGDTHVSTVIPIPAKVFALAKVMEWPTYTMLREPKYTDLRRYLAQAEQDALYV